MVNKKIQPVDWKSLLAGKPHVKRLVEYRANRVIYRQGQPADSLFYLSRGKVKLTVISKQGKEATLAILSAGDFFGEGCLADQKVRMATATAVTVCECVRLGKLLMKRILDERHEISELFVAYLLSRNIRYEADLVDRFFNSNEKRLARLLLLLSHFGKESRAAPILPRVSQAKLAQLTGTTPSRISRLMNKFRNLGFIDYGNNGALIVQSGLLSTVLHDQYPSGIPIKSSAISTESHSKGSPQIAGMDNSDQTGKKYAKESRLRTHKVEDLKP
jgi:CRP-like cAMP-binding protein